MVCPDRLSCWPLLVTAPQWVVTAPQWVEVGLGLGLVGLRFVPSALASEPDAVHVVLDRHLVTGQNTNSTVPAVQNLLFLCGSR